MKEALPSKKRRAKTPPVSRKKNVSSPGEKEKLAELFATCSADPHSVCGMHTTVEGVLIRVYDPAAISVSVRASGKVFPMEKTDPRGLFQYLFRGEKEHFAYELEKVFANGSSFVSHDPYQFLPGIGDMDLYLFGKGEHHRIYDVMGAHVRKMGDVEGVLFTVWAPNAARVSVVGDFNNWDGRRHMMRLMGLSGVWELFIPSLKEGDLYKFEIRDRKGNVFTKLDPYAFHIQKRPENAAKVPSPAPFPWQDGEWMEKRSRTDLLKSPASIYEVHLSSWRGPGLRELKGKEDFHNYRELATALAAYVRKMNFTHIELLPVNEHPLDQSWGYQTTGMYAPTSRYGTPEDFAFFVDHMHRNGIGVLMDWVPAHFPKDAFSLGRFDGTALYEHADPRKGEQKDWGTYIYNFGRHEVRNFLIGSALYFLDRFHIDGLRVDAVASMLYLDYSRKEGEWIPNEYGGNRNLEAIEFLRQLNTLTHGLFPGTVMIAEESTSFPGVSHPVSCGGLGFTLKWNMGWMHDSLDYFSLDPLFRSGSHDKLTFSLLYAFSENFVLPFSHDEVVHGKHSLLDRMPGDYEQKFANLRALYTYMFTHPGKKLLFMGGEFAQWIEWNCNAGLDWNLLGYPKHAGMQKLLAELNKLYRENPPLWEEDFSPVTFQWLDCNDARDSIYSYMRRDAAGDALVIVLNLTPVVREEYVCGVPFPGEWEELFSSDEARFGGTGIVNTGPLEAVEEEYQNQKYALKLRLPWLGGIILKKRSSTEKSSEALPEGSGK